MEKSSLPPELFEDPLIPLAKRLASDEELRRVSGAIAKAQVELDQTLAQTEFAKNTCRRYAWFGAGMLALCALIFLVFGSISTSRMLSAMHSDADADNRLKIVKNGETAARQHTFGAYFDPADDGYYIRFPASTKIFIASDRCKQPCIVVRPSHAR